MCKFGIKARRHYGAVQDREGDSFSLDLPETATVRAPRCRKACRLHAHSSGRHIEPMLEELSLPCGVTQYVETVALRAGILVRRLAR